MTSPNGATPMDQAQPGGVREARLPPHALLSGFPMGILAAATAFDFASQFTATPCSNS